MFKVKVLTVGKCKETWLALALAEYEKRLKGRLEMEWRIAKNNTQLIEWASEEPHLVALDVQGELLSSEAFSRKLLQLLTAQGSRLSFLIGGSEGIPKELHCQIRLSLSPLTFTHQAVRLLLAEQLYRALEIEKGGPYHK